jgi:hypothetical protein
MAKELDRRLSQIAPCLDFKKIESSEVILNRHARQSIRRACTDFLGVAATYSAYPPFNGATSRRTARAILSRATTARRDLSDLVHCLFDAVTHEFTLSEPFESNGFFLLLRRAIDVISTVARLPDDFHCLRRSSSRSKPPAARLKVGLEDRLDRQFGRHLHHAVPHRRYPQRPLPPVPLGDVSPPHR